MYKHNSRWHITSFYFRVDNVMNTQHGKVRSGEKKKLRRGDKRKG